MWRDIKDYVADHPLEIGESIRTRHTACAHRTVDETLAIRRTEDGYIGYCHRCQSGSGFGGSTTEPNYRQTKGNSTSKGGKNWTPDKRVKTIAEFPPQARLWLAKSAITSATLEGEGVQFSERDGCILFPVGNGWVRRHYAPDMPKYTSTVPFQLRRSELQRVYALPQHTLVIVEDWLSCLQCSLAGYDSLALFTTSIRPQALAAVLKHPYKRVLVALDNDNVTVIANQRKLLRTFRLAYDNVSVIELDKDPKEFEIIELQEILG